MKIESVELLILGWSTLMTIANIGLGWLINRIFKMLDDLRAEDEMIKRDLAYRTTAHAEIYARRDDVRNFKDEVLVYLRRIEDKLDGKADKQ